MKYENSLLYHFFSICTYIIIEYIIPVNIFSFLLHFRNFLVNISGQNPYLAESIADDGIRYTLQYLVCFQETECDFRRKPEEKGT